MNIEELKSEWKVQDKKIEKYISLNKKLLTTIQSDKSRGFMRNFMVRRIFETIVFSIIVILLWFFIVNNPVFSAATISAALLNLFAIIGLIGSIGQIVLITKIDYADSIEVVQKQIFDIRSHALTIAKLVMSSIPFYMAYIFLGANIFFGIDLFLYGGSSFLLAQTIFSVVLIFPTVWLIRKLDIKNIKTKLDRAIINTIAGEQLQMAADVLVEIEES